MQVSTPRGSGGLSAVRPPAHAGGTDLPRPHSSANRCRVWPALSGGRLFGAFAGEAGFAFAGACVAEGFVEGAVGAFGGVCEDACDDEFGFGVEGIVGGVAFDDGVGALRVEFFYLAARCA